MRDEPDHVVEEFKKHLAQSGLPNIRHDLCHSAATLLLSQGIRPKEAIQIVKPHPVAERLHLDTCGRLGRRDERTTDRPQSHLCSLTQDARRATAAPPLPVPAPTFVGSYISPVLSSR